MEKEQINDGGTAFPWEDTQNISGLPGPSAGISKRDYFAAYALQAIMLAAFQNHLVRSSDSLIPLGPEDYALAAYENADAMIAARGKEVA